MEGRMGLRSFRFPLCCFHSDVSGVRYLMLVGSWSRLYDQLLFVCTTGIDCMILTVLCLVLFNFL